MARKTTNCVSEWFGHRVYPSVSSSPPALQDQLRNRCPFLSAATGEDRKCVKARSSYGVCTISSLSNGPRQDWLVCPYRGLSSSLLDDVVDRLFSGASAHDRFLLPAPNLARKAVQQEIVARAEEGRASIIYFQDKLGGEISISRTARSPEMSFDITMVEIGHQDGKLVLPRYGILELQTMDFHGSYRNAVKNLEDALRLHGNRFHETLARNPSWLGERIEGPNIANVFKRTFYQAMLKFQVANQKDCVGTILALPEAVWDSWQRHLGAPDLVQRTGKSAEPRDFELRKPNSAPFPDKVPAWIYVFDLDEGSDMTPNPVALKKRIATDADSVSHFALKVAPEAAFGTDGAANLISQRVKQRISAWWPEIQDLLTW